MRRPRGYARRHRHAILICLLIVVAYFVIPVEPDVSSLRVVLRAVGTGLAVLAIALLVARQVRQQARQGPGGTSADLLRLAVALVGGLMTFALADYVIQLSDPDQFIGLRTRIDALYFALATLTTVGYGDVHAQGQFARASVIIQMVFSVGVVATGASLLIKGASERSGR
ncbi:potassium channel family protein [Plantactinospora sp. KBS50]|uniref:potassium channel family protein n=1 Tax=Plantactinospora sp. KBS50 TaxID=2024580 RepID=UPI000BAAFAA5|nr:potassium channel family protein [Plantactinospora sp. KBS50]ASW54432.1 ion transporter [Plantactinospora sp. KBS50]